MNLFVIMTKLPDNLLVSPLHDFAGRGLRIDIGRLAERPDPSIRDAQFFRCAHGIFVFQPAGTKAEQDPQPGQEIQFE
ncbi:MAG: hypothetical protein NTAFB09_15020 [Nitrosospira sp.]